MRHDPNPQLGETSSSSKDRRHDPNPQLVEIFLAQMKGSTTLSIDKGLSKSLKITRSAF